MRVLAYEIEDKDVMDLWFGPTSIPRPLKDFGEEHGTLILDKVTDAVPTEDDILVDGTAEYLVIVRVFYPREGEVHLIVYRRELPEAQLS